MRDYYGRKPIHRAEIVFLSESGQHARVIVQSDPIGRFVISHLVPDYYDIEISRKGYESEEFKHVAIPRENRVLIESTLRKHKQFAVCQ